MFISLSSKLSFHNINTFAVVDTQPHTRENREPQFKAICKTSITTAYSSPDSTLVSIVSVLAVDGDVSTLIHFHNNL